LLASTSSFKWTAQDFKKSKKSSEVANTRRKPQEFQVVHVVEAIKEETELDSKFLQGRGGSCIGLPRVLSFKTLLDRLYYPQIGCFYYQTVEEFEFSLSLVDHLYAIHHVETSTVNVEKQIRMSCRLRRKTTVGGESTKNNKKQMHVKVGDICKFGLTVSYLGQVYSDFSPQQH
jgi:hypothetical protein